MNPKKGLLKTNKKSYLLYSPIIYLEKFISSGTLSWTLLLFGLTNGLHDNETLMLYMQQ